MVNLTEKERIEILMIIGFGDRRRTQQEVCVLFNNLYPERDPITRTVVSKTLRRFNMSGNVRNLSKPGRPTTVTSQNEALDIAIMLEENPQTSTPEIARARNISRRSVARILKREKYHPYKIQLVQELSEDDFDRRIEFCERLMEICNNDHDFAHNVVFSDEATFCLNGTVNRHNCRYWSMHNPHWIQEARTQYPQKLNVWAGIFRQRIIGPYFIDGSLTGRKYVELLQNEIIPELLRVVGDELRNNVWFQQDGAPPHYSLIARQFLNNTFPNRWIGRRGFIEWPARSPDLNPLDFFLWGYLKSKVYTQRPTDLEELKIRIRYEAGRIPPDFLINVTRGFVDRLAYCQQVNGGHFEQLIK